ncbi:MAG TPA: hypothetical protein VJ904_00900, partial [Tichowtungia sp.]|nr:hypothetical protein [Tichowtungia sp.]
MNTRTILPRLLLGCGLAASICSAQKTPAEPTYDVSLSQAHKGTLDIDRMLLDSFERLPENRRAFYLRARNILVGSPNASPEDPEIIEAAKKF